MPKLELLASGPGTGKTTYCIDLFRKEILKSPAGLDSRAYFVLPSREHASRIQNLVLKKGLPGLFNVHILTLPELAARLEEGGAPARPGEALRRSLLRHLIEDPASSWPYFEPVRGLSGFYELLSERVQEFSSARIDGAEFERRAKALKEPVSRAKARDFAALLRAYEAELAARGMAESAGAVQASGVGLVLFDGFYHFTQQQRELIRALSRQAAHVVVSLTLPADSARRAHAFTLAAQTRVFLSGLGFKPSSAPLFANHRVKEPALLHLERSLFMPKCAPLASAQKAVSVTSAATVREEVEGIAREIRRLHASTDWHFSDMAVILRSVRGYDKPVEAVFSEFEIPVYVHERKKLVESGLGRFVHRFLALVSEEEPEGESGAALFRSNYCPDAGPERLSECGKKLLSARSGRAFRLQLAGFLRGCRLDASDRAPLAALENLLLRAEGSAHPGAFRAKDFIEEILRSLEVALYSDRPAGKNRVQVYDAVMALPKEYRVVFVAGLLDQVFPAAAGEDALFKDEERAVLNGRDPRLELRESRRAGERYFFYMAVTRARERLYLSYPEKDRDGRAFLPSPFVEEVKRCFKESPALSGAGWAAAREAEKAAARLLFSRTAPPEREKKELAAFVSLKKDDVRFARVLEYGRRPEGARLNDARILKALGADEDPYSPTRLEEYLTCAFKYFAKNTLKLKPYAEDRLARDKGTLLHLVLDRFYNATRDEQKNDAFFWKDGARVTARLQKYLEKLFPESPLAAEPVYRQRYLLEEMKRTLAVFVRREAEYAAGAGLVPGHFELEFGRTREGKPAPLPYLELGKGLRVGGIIDRVDVSADGRQGYVIDYKLGFRDLQKKIDKGLEVQLPVYLLAVEKLLKLEPLGAELRFLQPGKSKALERESVPGLMRETEKRVAQASAGIRGGDIAVRSKSCEYCDFESVCRFEKWKLIYSEVDPHA